MTSIDVTGALTDNIVALLIDDLYLRHDVGITEESLLQWIHSEYKVRFNVILERETIQKSLEELSDLGFISRKSTDGEIFVSPAYRYYTFLNDERLSSPSAASISIDHSRTTSSSLIENIESPNDSIIEEIARSLGCGIDGLKPLERLSYAELLHIKTKGYKGNYKQIMGLAPFFFDLLENLLTDRFTDWHVKIMIDSALAYLVLKDDVVPDDSEIGLVDDVYIMTHVLSAIKERFSEAIIRKHWEYPEYREDVCELIDGTHGMCEAILEDDAPLVLHKIGIAKFIDLKLEEYSGTYQERMKKLAHEKRELIALLAFLMQKIEHTNIKGLSVEKIKRQFKRSADYDEIERLLELSKLDHQIQELKKQPDSFEQDFEDMMNRVIFETLVERNTSSGL